MHGREDFRRRNDSRAEFAPIGVGPRPPPVTELHHEDALPRARDNVEQVWRLKDVPCIQADAQARMIDTLDDFQSGVEPPNRGVCMEQHRIERFERDAHLQLGGMLGELRQTLEKRREDEFVVSVWRRAADDHERRTWWDIWCDAVNRIHNVPDT